MKRYVLFDVDSYGIKSIFKGFHEGDNPPEGAIIITEHQLTTLINEVNVKFNLLWYDGESIRVRSKFTKWDADAQFMMLMLKI